MQLKRMTAHYPGKCAKCKQRFPAGTPILWSKETGALHSECADGGNGQENKQETKPPKPQQREIPNKSAAVVVEGKEAYFTIDWPELREYLKRAVDGDTSFVKHSRNRDIARWVSGGLWAGFTKNQVRDWLKNGYQTEAIRGLEDFTPPLREKRHYVYAEEGEEIFVDRVLSGEDNFMGQWTKRERIPGVALEAEIMFAASVSAQVVNAYNAWICKAVYALETAGIDCQVTLKFSTDSLVVDGEMAHSIVRVKKENEGSDFYSFSPMLSPAALRGFGFSVCALHADSRGRDYRHGVGHGRQGRHGSGSWSVVWNSHRRVIEVDCPYFGGTSRNFPEEDMTRQLRAVLHEMKTEG